MRFYEITAQPQKLLTPQQSKINSLKRNVEIAKQAVDAERKAQQISKAQKRIQYLSGIN